MKPVVQEDRTGCAIASVAALAGRRYGSVKRVAASLGIDLGDPTLWSETLLMRRLLAEQGIEVGRREEPFMSWEALPDLALLAIKWHVELTGPAWHWVVFVRDEEGAAVLDSKRALRTNRRTDFGRIRPKWFIRASRSDEDGRTKGRMKFVKSKNRKFGNRRLGTEMMKTEKQK